MSACDAMAASDRRSEITSVPFVGDSPARPPTKDRLMPLHAALFVETSPSPTKYALSVLGRMADEVRLPMVPVTEPTRRVVEKAMVHAGLING